jgi:hypothetical protein
MCLHADLGLSHQRGRNRGNEKAEAPAAMRPVHDAETDLRLNPPDLDIETDFQGASEQPHDEERGKDGRSIGQERNGREQRHHAEQRDRERRACAEPDDQRRGEGERNQRADRHADQCHPQFRLVDTQTRLQVGQA